MALGFFDGSLPASPISKPCNTAAQSLAGRPSKDKHSLLLFMERIVLDKLKDLYLLLNDVSWPNLQWANLSYSLPPNDRSSDHATGPIFSPNIVPNLPCSTSKR